MIGIYGGTFDPVHFGHLRTALEIREQLGLTQVRLIPCANPPHRPTPLTAAALRLHMLQLALAGQTDLVADACELQRPGASYTVDTLREQRLRYPGTPLVLFMGMDAFAGLEAWHQWQQLFDYAHVVVMTRPGFALGIDNPWLQARQVDAAHYLHQTLAGCLFIQAVTPLAISATAIRRLIAEQRSPRFLLPDSVIDFIEQQQLYKQPSAA